MAVNNKTGALALLLLGCGEVIPAMPDVSAMPDHEPTLEAQLATMEVNAPSCASDAITFAVARYNIELGLKLDPSEIGVRWWWTGGQLGARELSGIEFACEDIWVWISPGMRCGGTSLAHELGHCVKALVTGDGDPGHIDQSWWGYDGYVNTALLALYHSSL